MPCHDGADRLFEAASVGQDLILDMLAEGDGHVGACDALDWCFEGIETILRDHTGELGSETATAIGIVEENSAAGFGDRLDKASTIEW